MTVSRFFVGALVFVALGVTLPAAAQIRTVLVSPVPGDVVASGTALLNALASITDNAADNRYLIKLEPGIYDVQNGSVQMKPWVDIEGSGEIQSCIQGIGNGPGDITRGIVMGADNAELRLVSVTATPNPEGGVQIPISIILTSPSIRNVTVVVNSGVICDGIAIGSGSPTIHEVTIRVACSNANRGMFIYGTLVATPTIERSKIVARNGSTNYGIEIRDLTIPALLRDLKVEAANGDTNYGIYYDPLVSTLITIVNSLIEAKTGSGTKYGVYMTGISPQVTLEQSQVKTLGGGTKTAIRSVGTLDVRNSILIGTANTIFNGGGTVRVGSSHLNGGAVFGVATCAAVYDENYAFFASTCP